MSSSQCEVVWYFDSAEPAYHFGSRTVYALLLVVHRLLPPGFATTICLFIRKQQESNS